MIVKFAKPGTSFKGVTVYLMHDVDHASTSERLAWTHTLNLAHDHVPSAVHEMYTTALDAELLKAEAGVRPGGRRTEKPVKHISLNWHPSERPDKEEMIRATTGFLKHMGWSEHQTVIIAHHDKEHRHVHLVINAIHPETGLKLDDRFEKRRAQVWALAYEQERGAVLCPERLKPVAEREPSPPRPVWERLHALQQSVDPEAALDSSIDGPLPPGWKAAEWRLLKNRQREQRMAFFAGGKEAYRQRRNEIYHLVRHTYRGEWAEYYALKRAGAVPDAIAPLRTALIAQQNEMLDHHRETAAKALREQRDATYQALLERQKDERADLTERQERGVPSSQLWQAQQAAELRALSREAGAPQPDAKPWISPDRQVSGSWTPRGGMPAQQRSAIRWLDDVGARIPVRPAPQPGASRSNLDAAEARRLQPRREREREAGKSVGAEPES